MLKSCSAQFAQPSEGAAVKEISNLQPVSLCSLHHQPVLVVLNQLFIIHQCTSSIFCSRETPKKPVGC